MYRPAFTMIELIFVIVILGILAAVSIPKLAATRDDAKEAKECQNIATCISDMAASYTAKNSAALSDSRACLDISGTVSLTNSGQSITVSGAPSMCSHLNGLRFFGGNRVSL